jgi:hypothetical protein
VNTSIQYWTCPKLKYSQVHGRKTSCINIRSRYPPCHPLLFLHPRTNSREKEGRENPELIKYVNKIWNCGIIFAFIRGVFFLFLSIRQNTGIK